ncbi:unnamed protein product [Durusdinium trenchii]
MPASAQAEAGTSPSAPASSSSSGPGPVASGRWRNRALLGSQASASSSSGAICTASPIGNPVPPPASAQVPQLRSAHGARVAMFSARFDGGETEQRFRAIHRILVGNGYDVLMVSVRPGESFADLTTRYLGRIHRENGVMLSVCTRHYGEMTSSEYSSFEEIKFAKTYRIMVLPLRVEEIYPPEPPGRGPNWPNHLDEHLDAQSYVSWVFDPARLYFDCRGKSEFEIASAIADSLHPP